MQNVQIARLGTVVLITFTACIDSKPLPLDGTSEGTDASPFYDETQPRLDFTASQKRTDLHGFQVPEDGDNPSAPPLGDPARVRVELAAIERELSEILDPLLTGLDERGVTYEQLEQAMGDIRAERMLLGLSLTEYHNLQRKIDDLLERAQSLLAARPLTRDGRGGDGTICTTTTTVDEWDNGTIVITDRESCWPWSPDDGDGPSGDDPPDGPGGGGGGGNGPTAFEFACASAGGEIHFDRCSCKRGAKCHDSIFEAGLAFAPCLIWPSTCVYSGLAWVRVMWMCRQKPCDEVNRRHGR